MVKCLLDGELVVLGGPNLLEASYYAFTPGSEAFKTDEILELKGNCKVVHELVDKHGNIGIKIIYIPCLDWSSRSDRLIELVIKQFLDIEREYVSSSRVYTRPPKIITVVQDKDYWPGSELDDPLVLQRRAAKEKEYMDAPQHRIKPDHKRVKFQLVSVGCLYRAKFLVQGVPRRHLVERKKKKLQLTTTAQKRTSVNHSSSLKRCRPDLAEVDCFDELTPKKCSKNDSDIEKLINEKSTSSTLVEPTKQIPVAEPSLLERFGVDSDGKSFFYAPIPRKRSVPYTLKEMFCYHSVHLSFFWRSKVLEVGNYYSNHLKTPQDFIEQWQTSA